MAGHAVARRLVTSGCALTRTTEWAASRWGTAHFLPALFADRVTHLGGIEALARLGGCAHQGEHLRVPVFGGDVVEGAAVFPRGARGSPTVLCAKGLEGVVAETLLPWLKYRGYGLAVFIMEMPGTYTYRQPLTVAAENVYRAVIDRLAADPRVDADRIGMLGLSFGAYWAARMAAADPRLRAVVANGAPADRTFRPSGAFGTPEIMMWTMANTTHARSTADLLTKLRALSLKDLYPRMTAPLLVINGDSDTLASTRDSIDIATHAPNALLKLYPGDDHCAMGHAQQWWDLSARFLADHLGAV